LRHRQQVFARLGANLNGDRVGFLGSHYRLRPRGVE